MFRAPSVVPWYEVDPADDLHPVGLAEDDEVLARHFHAELAPFAAAGGEEHTVEVARRQPASRSASSMALGWA